MRLSKEVVAKREEFVKQKFKDNLDLSVRAVNDLIRAEFGKEMRPMRILEIKRGLQLQKLADHAHDAKAATMTNPQDVQQPVVMVLDRREDTATTVSAV